MNESTPVQLKVYREQAVPDLRERPRPIDANNPSTDPLFDPLWSAPVNPGVGVALGHLGVEPKSRSLKSGRGKPPATAEWPSRRIDRPSIRSPLSETWEFAWRESHSGQHRGSFCDWFTTPEDALAVVLGETAGHGVLAALNAAGLHAGVLAQGRHHRSAAELLAAVNQTVWQLTMGDAPASLACLTLEENSGTVRYGAAGHLGAILLRGEDWRSLSAISMPLGLQPEVTYPENSRDLLPGDVLVLFSDRTRTTPTLDGHGADEADEARLAKLLLPHSGASAENLAATLDAHFASEPGTPANGEYLLAVIRYRG